MLFRLYTSLEVKAEAERQATQLWEEGFTYAPAMTGDDTGARDRSAGSESPGPCLCHTTWRTPEANDELDRRHR